MFCAFSTIVVRYQLCVYLEPPGGCHKLCLKSLWASIFGVTDSKLHFWVVKYSVIPHVWKKSFLCINLHQLIYIKWYPNSRPYWIPAFVFASLRIYCFGTGSTVLSVAQGVIKPIVEEWRCADQKWKVRANVASAERTFGCKWQPNN